MTSDASFPRPLDETEKALVRDLIEKAGVAETEVLLRQVEVAEVTAPCSCPCPSVSLGVDPALAESASYTAKPAASADYDGGNVMVWVEDGFLSNLEMTWWTDETPLAFPPVDALSDHRPG